MKKIITEKIILIIQLFIFYIFPLSLYTLEPITMVLLMLLMTIVLSLILGIISKNKIKYLYPIIISILFLPTVFIYYNSSAIVHSIWYLIISTIGLFVGVIIKIIMIKLGYKKK